jgi:division protein CdvB (Snf7/Vps24/ESCRT-III family)
MELLQLINLINAAMTAGINVYQMVARVEAMREQSGGHLTDDQVAQLEESARESVDRLGPQ